MNAERLISEAAEYQDGSAWIIFDTEELYDSAFAGDTPWSIVTELAFHHGYRVYEWRDLPLPSLPQKQKDYLIELINEIVELGVAASESDDAGSLYALEIQVNKKLEQMHNVLSAH